MIFFSQMKGNERYMSSFTVQVSITLSDKSNNNVKSMVTKQNCNVCGNSFKDVQGHQRRMHGIQPRCVSGFPTPPTPLSLCQPKTSSSFVFGVDGRTRSSRALNFKCSLCTSTFKTERGLKIHQRHHTTGTGPNMSLQFSFAQIPSRHPFDF